MPNEVEAEVMSNQALIANKDLIIKTLEQLVENLSACENYIEQVIVIHIT